MNQAIQVLSCNRVTLLPMESDHLLPLYEAAQFKEIWEYLPIKVNNLKDMERLINEALIAKSKGNEIPFVVFDHDTEKVVGMTRFLNISVENRNLEIGWTWYAPTVWRTRVNTECKYIMLSYAFEKFKAVRVQFKADRRNHRSNTAIKRIGATFEGVLRKDRIMEDGYIRDTVYHSILESEWPFVKEQIQHLLNEKYEINIPNKV